MKLYLSADIEGTAGVVKWSETEPEDQYYPYFANEMTQEVRCACEGAMEAGVNEILVKDAHHTATNINPEKLPEIVKIMRGWTRGPQEMMAGVDGGFDAAAMVGYHSASGTNGNPLAHTMNTQNESVTLNGRLASEFMINAYTAAYYKVPVVFVSGDRSLCESAKKLIPSITAVPVSEGIGNASVSLHPAAAQGAIRKGMLQAMQGDLSECLLKLPESFEVSILFHVHDKAYYASYYPGARSDGLKTVTFHASDYFEVLRFLLFVL
ncbi:D-aminopeptidase [Caprobacter fermentans]|uniref:D-aminopeptidase n=1 Tax=Caproicibacter fermentans TaxID=2576756 RepID=A0A6N8I4E7_9FIRM|nr:M55 family metallopeptidase [Caproicibacter fermentans]MVB12373.1 D-aminopeptidase [Caproicibacter fermentans]OCN03057.1 amino acid amidase [Clostridium sp. W14A]